MPLPSDDPLLELRAAIYLLGGRHKQDTSESMASRSATKRSVSPSEPTDGSKTRSSWCRIRFTSTRSDGSATSARKAV